MTRIFQARLSQKPMVPQHNTPEEPPRSLSPEIEAELEQALRGLSAGATPAYTERLTAAVQAAGRDARDRKLRAEELLVLFKNLEFKIGGTIPEQDVHGRDALRTRMIRALLEAYYRP